MQVATLFGSNLTPLVSKNTMNTSTSSEESVLAAMEEDEETTKMAAKHTPTTSVCNVDKLISSSVISLVSLASNALERNQQNLKSQPIDDENKTKSSAVNAREGSKIEPIDDENADDNILKNKESVISPSEKDSEEIVVANLENKTSQSPNDCDPTSPSSSFDMKEPKRQIKETSSSPVSLEHNNNSYNDCEETNQESSSQGTTLLFHRETDESPLSKTFTHQKHQISSESNQLQYDEIPSSTIPSNNIRETNGCVTNNNISEMNELEAQNLVIHHNNDHSNMILRKEMSSSPEMKSFLHSQSQISQQEERHLQMELGEPMDQQEHKHAQQIEFEHHQITQQQHMNQQNLPTAEAEEQRHSESNENPDKHNRYSHSNRFEENHRNNLNVDEISQRNIRDQQMPHNSLNSQVENYKMQHIPENLEMMNQMDHQQQQYEHHLSQNQHNMLQHQHAQQLYLQHQDQQHMIHQHHQQQHHHSELMAYLHHQDQQAMQQPHHVRTYQHYPQHRMDQLPQHPQPQSPRLLPKNSSMTCIDDLMIDELHDDPNNRYKLLSPTVKHESQDDGYETSAGDVLTPNSHTSSQHSMTPQHQMHSSNLIPPVKCEDVSAAQHRDPDPYSFIDEEINSNIRMMSPSSANGISMVMRHQNYESPPASTRLLIDDGQNLINLSSNQQMLDSRMPNVEDMSGNVENISVPKKRGRKKKCSEEIGMRNMVDGILKPILPKERKKHDRFNGMSEEEVSKRTLPDHLADNLDIIIIGINPGLFAAYKGHHYAGPGNHFWKCLYLSGLTHEQMTAEEDYKLLKFGIGFTNMVERATKGSADLTRKEIKEGSRILLDKLKRYRPKIAVFNGKLIFEVFSGKKDFNFGRQQECVEGTDTYMWVMPSSSARCAQLPRAADKVPFYAALKKFRDYLNGLIPHIDEMECVFNEQKTKQCCGSESVRAAGGNPPSSPVVCGSSGPTFLSPDCINTENQSLSFNNSNSSTPESSNHTDVNTNLNIMHKGSPMDSMIISGGDNSVGCGGMIIAGMNRLNPTNLNPMHMTCNMDQPGQPEKKKRGRPKKIKGLDGEEGPLPQKARNTTSLMSNNSILNLTMISENGEIPKKKRGRPKKIKSATDIAVNLNHGAGCMTTGNSSGQLSANNNSIDNSSSGIHNDNVKSDICLHRNSPSSLGNHQMLSMNNSNHFNSQSISQQQPLQNQRLFSSPMHSPNAVSSYCPMGMNASTTPPIGNNTNSNNSNLGSNGIYHQHQHPSSQHIQHNHIQQQHVQHQLHIPSLMYMQSPNHNQQQQQSSKSPHYGSSHSDLSTEISAAISSDHLCESQQSASSPAMVCPADYDRPASIPSDEHSAHDLRFTSPTPNSADQQQGGGVQSHQTHHYHNIYQNSGSNQSYLSGNTSSHLGNSPGEPGAGNTNNDENINYLASTRQNTSNSNNSTSQQSAQIQTQQQRNLQISDVTSKSLSGLESLVDQIPTISEGGDNTSSLNSSAGGMKSDSNENYPSPTPGGSGAGSSNSGLGCIYIPSYSNLNSSSPSTPSAAPSNSSILSPHHYPDPIYSMANTCPSSTNTNSNNNINYNGIASNFSVSSLTSNNYPSNSYHSNLMAAAATSSPHHITSSATGSPIYLDPHMAVAVSPIYHHPYAQHAGYGAYSSVVPPPPPPPTLHMPSPNYPYAYSNTSSYPSQTGHHHPSHSSSTGYLANHPSMFDRIKPDIGYGGY